MSITTFFFDFQARYEKALSGMEKVKKEAHGTAGAVGNIEGKLKGMAANAGAYLGGFMALGAIGQQVLAAADAMDKLADASDVIGMKVEDLDAWGRSVSDAGGSVESFQGSMKTLAKDLATFQVKGKSGKTDFFKELGLDQKKFKTVGDMLPELASKFGELSDTEALGMGEKLGLDEQTVAVLKQGKEATMKMIDAQKKLGVMSEEDKKKIQAFGDSVDKAGHILTNVFRSIWMTVLPAVKWLADGFATLADVWAKHSKTIINGVLIFAGIMAAVFLPELVALIASLLATGAAWIVAFWPIVAIVALVGLLAAAIAIFFEDFSAWVAGGNSQLGDWLGSWAGFSEGIKDYLRGIKEYWQGVLDDIMAGVESMKAKFLAAKEFLSHPFGGGDEAGNSNASAVVDSATGTVMNAAPPSGGTTSNQSSTVQVGSVTVNTQATDANGVAGALGSELTNQLQQANANSDDGISH